MGLFSFNTKKDLVAVFDISSGSVGGALVQISEKESGTHATILYSTRVPIIFQTNLNFERFLASMLSSLVEVSSELEKQKLGAPKDVFCFLASPWYASQTRIIKLSKEAPFTITEKIIKGLIDAEVKAFETEELKKYSGLGNHTRIIENETVVMSVNGYKTESPLGRKARDLELTLFMSMSPERVTQSVEHIIKKHFNVSTIRFSSFIFSFFVAVRDLFMKQENFLLLDIGGEITDLAIVKNNILHESVSFPLGKSFLIRRIASSLNTTPEEGLSLLRIFLAGDMEETQALRLKDILEKARIEWLSSFQSSLATISNDLSLPETVFITVDDDVSSWFFDSIKKEEYNQYTLTEKQFNVIMLGASPLNKVSEFAASLKSRDQFLMIESIFITRIINRIHV